MEGVDLKSIIDQVTRYATSNIGGHGQTAAQGRALLGLGEIVSNMEQTQSKIASAEKLGLMGNESEIERQKIASTPAMMEQTSLDKMISAKGIGGQSHNTNGSLPSNWWTSDLYKGWKY